LTIRIRGALALLCVLLLPTGCTMRATTGTAAPAGPPDIRVGLKVRVPGVTVGSSGAYRLLGPDGNELLAAEAGEAYLAGLADGRIAFSDVSGRTVASSRGPVRVRPADALGTVDVDGASYHGEIVLRRSPKGGLNAIHPLDLETYLRGVVPKEIGTGGTYFQAAKAQAVAARTYALHHLGQYEKEGYDVEAGTQDQVYGGADARNEAADRAVAETRGLVLTYDGEPINAKFASTCGGVTSAAEESFDYGVVPYLPAQVDRLDDRAVSCRTSRYFRWYEEWSGVELFRMFAQTVPAETGRAWRGRYLKNVRVAETGESGRAVVLRISTDEATYDVEKSAIRRVLLRSDGGMLRSNFFTLQATHEGQALRRIAIEGKGWGHGVGLCQWGAMQLSTEGVAFDRILAFYYSGTRLEDRY
jgi:stage II sporulation protein D